MASKKVIDEGFDIAKNIANDVMNAIKGKTEDAVKVAPKKIVVAPKVVVAPVAKVKPAPKVKVEPAVEPDWGFQPKPGEVSGTRAIEAKYSHDTPGINVNIDPVVKAKAKKDWEQFKTQIDTAVNKNKLPEVDTRGNYEYEQIADDLAGLESAGVPREHTGEIIRMLNNPNLGSKKVGYKTYNYNVLTKDLQKLSSKEERSLYISMLPQWDDTRQSLVKFVKSDTALQAKDAAREAANKAAKVQPLEKTIANEVSNTITTPKVEVKPIEAVKEAPLEKTIADEVSDGMTTPKVEAKPVVSNPSYNKLLEDSTNNFNAIERYHFNWSQNNLSDKSLSKYNTITNKYLGNLNETRKKLADTIPEKLDIDLENEIYDLYDMVENSNFDDVDANIFEEPLVKLKSYIIATDNLDSKSKELFNRLYDNFAYIYDTEHWDLLDEVDNVFPSVRELDETQLSEFFTLLPEWDQSIEELVQAVKIL